MRPTPRRAAILAAALLAAACDGSRSDAALEASGAKGASSAPAAAPAPPPAPAPAGGAPAASPIPPFRKPDPAKSKKTPAGLVCEVVSEGTGPGPVEGESFEMEYSFWTPDGVLHESSHVTGAAIQGRREDMALAFLKQAPGMLREGGEAIFEVPADLAFGNRPAGRIPPGSTTIWRLRLVRVGRVRPLPPFEAPAEKDLRRTKSGLGIKVLKEGSGAAPRMGERVVVHYAGWLTDGKPFDSSYKRGLPFSFRVGRGEVIAGWDEGLQELKPGGEAILAIPAALGYGARGAGRDIPPNADLLFRVELLEVKK